MDRGVAGEESGVLINMCFVCCCSYQYLAGEFLQCLWASRRTWNMEYGRVTPNIKEIPTNMEAITFTVDESWMVVWPLL